MRFLFLTFFTIIATYGQSQTSIYTSLHSTKFDQRLDLGKFSFTNFIGYEFKREDKKLKKFELSYSQEIRENRFIDMDGITKGEKEKYTDVQALFLRQFLGDNVKKGFRLFSISGLAYRKSNLMPFTANSFEKNTYSFIFRTGFSPEFAISLTDNLIIDLKVPIYASFASLNYKRNENPNIPIQSQKTLDITFLSQYFIQPGIGLRWMISDRELKAKKKKGRKNKKKE